MTRKKIDIYLQPGDYFVGHGNYTVRTLLGSCVSFTLWHPERRVGAMSHFLLPTRGTSTRPHPDARYGDEALELILQDLARFAVEPAQCHAKIFGGASMFPKHAHADAPHVGRRNGEAARSLLRAHGINVVSESLFGAGHRQIVFDVHSGDVWARHAQLPSTDQRETGQRETR